MSGLTKVFVALLIIGIPYIVIESNRQANDPVLNQVFVTPTPQQSDEFRFDEQLGTYVSNDGYWQWNDQAQKWEISSYGKTMEFVDRVYPTISYEDQRKQQQIRCQEQMSRYTVCLQEYDVKLSEYNACIGSATTYPPPCFKPYNSCFKPRC